MAFTIEEYIGNNPMRKEQFENARRSLAKAKAKQVDGWAGAQSPTPEPSLLERASTEFGKGVGNAARTTEKVDAGLKNLLQRGGTESNQANMGGMSDLFKGKPKIEDKTTYQGIGDKVDKALGLAPKAEEKSLIPKQSTVKTSKKTRDVADVKPVRDEYVTRLEPQEQKMVRNTVTETQSEIKQAAEDPSIFAQAAEQLGIAGNYAASLFENFDNPLDRVDWLTMATIYAASRSQGNNATMAIANGLMRGMESKGRQEQAKAMMEMNQQKSEKDQDNKDRQYLLDKYDAESRRMNAEAATQRASEAGKGLLGALNPDQRKIADAAAESFGGDSALAYEAANQILKDGGQVSTMAVKKVMKQMQDKGYATKPKIFGKATLM